MIILLDDISEEFEYQLKSDSSDNMVTIVNIA
jgi:hypothetical protein